jgi:hypothetical protein
MGANFDCRGRARAGQREWADALRGARWRGEPGLRSRGLEAFGELRELRRPQERAKCGDQNRVVMIVFKEMRAILFLRCGEQNLWALGERMAGTAGNTYVGRTRLGVRGWWWVEFEVCGACSVFSERY